MGMFDEPTYPDWLQDKFPNGTPFKMEGLRIGDGTVPGNRPGEPRRAVVIVTVDGAEYAATGVGFENQARNVAPGDLPAFVKVDYVDAGKNGDGTPKKVKRFIPA